MLLKEISCLDAACYGYAVALLRVGWSSEWQHVGYGATPGLSADKNTSPCS